MRRHLALVAAGVRRPDMFYDQPPVLEVAGMLDQEAVVRDVCRQTHGENSWGQILLLNPGHLEQTAERRD